MTNHWDGTTERRVAARDWGERIAILESERLSDREVIAELREQAFETREILDQIHGAMKFIKIIAWVAGAGMSAWGLILAQMGVHVEGLHK